MKKTFQISLSLLLTFFLLSCKKNNSVLHQDDSLVSSGPSSITSLLPVAAFTVTPMYIIGSTLASCDVEVNSDGERQLLNVVFAGDWLQIQQLMIPRPRMVLA
ncbi:hypothetical protein [Pedobacter sp. HMWF019]|uniref:hypothetical protein n=1 Tax=Pedobacter sp. HMWF019 TaxID=2056856 RepID=UPI0011B278D4|nr:hypothetical protein [Pedobacter sp. HMWF019]